MSEVNIRGNSNINEKIESLQINNNVSDTDNKAPLYIDNDNLKLSKHLNLKGDYGINNCKDLHFAGSSLINYNTGGEIFNLTSGNGDSKLEFLTTKESKIKAKYVEGVEGKFNTLNTTLGATISGSRLVLKESDSFGVIEFGKNDPNIIRGMLFRTYSGNTHTDCFNIFHNINGLVELVSNGNHIINNNCVVKNELSVEATSFFKSVQINNGTLTVNGSNIVDEINSVKNKTNSINGTINVYNNNVVEVGSNLVVNHGLHLGSKVLNPVLICGGDANNNPVNSSLTIQTKNGIINKDRYKIYNNQHLYGNDTASHRWYGSAGADLMYIKENGEVRAPIFIDTSDDRLKHNEVKIQNALSTIQKLTPYTYDKTIEMKDKDYNGEVTNAFKETGFIAQDVFKIPELKHCVVEGDEKTPYALKYNSIFCFLVQAVQELSKKVNDLEKKIEEANVEAKEETTLKIS